MCHQRLKTKSFLIISSIQVWFPLPEGSPFNWAAPVIDKETCSAFRSRPELRTGLQKAFTRIIKFYGFEASYKGEEVHIYRSINPIPAFRNWVVRLDHNHLRITRVIRSLRVLGLEQNAQAFYKAIQDVNRDFPDRIGKRSMMYWERAAVRRLALAPDESDETVKGQSFLRELDEAIKETETVAETEAVVETKAVAETEAVEETKVTEETKAAEETKDA